jgi:ABC-type polysaccharide/polyol phosphate transport system ATPase subunit
MSDLAVRARNLSKIYKLYATPTHRLYDVLGFHKLAANGIGEHRALTDLSFEIMRGEKVAIIGRNGAGKSTLLKLITRVIMPTSGELTVTGETRALLSLGTGFHGEFTGRQNAEAYLASLGISGPELARLVQEAIAFAEIEEYADQPVKTYSTGMGVRLMFATSTMMTPDLLVIDEVLGAGDAYFQHKSFERIRELCGAKSATLLLVTHDVFSAAQLCDRMIWIDRGRILIDADPGTVLAAYNDSIRVQEERRLRFKTLGNGSTATVGKRRVLVEIHAEGNQPLAAPIFIADIGIRLDGVGIASARLGDDAFEPKDGSALIAEASAWGEPVQHAGRLARQFRNWGSNFHKVAAAFEIPADDEQLNRLEVEILARTDRPTAARVLMFADGFERDLGSLALDEGQWLRRSLPDEVATAPPRSAAAEAGSPPRPTPSGSITNDAGVAVRAMSDAAVPDPHADAAVVEMDVLAAQGAGDPAHTPAPAAAPPRASAAAVDVNTQGIYGTGDVVFHRLQCIDAQGRDRRVLDFGMPITLRLSYTINAPDFDKKIQLVLAFRRDGVSDVWRLFARDVSLPVDADGEGSIECTLTRLPLALGQYTVVILAAREGYYDRNQSVFFSMNPELYFSNLRIHEILVTGATQLYANTGSVLEIEWWPP